MGRYWLFTVVLLSFLAGMFLLFDVLHIPLLKDPRSWMVQGDLVTAVVGVGLLVVDVLLPVPSSLVMISNGLVFGVLGGCLLSLAGSMGATWLAFGIGRWGGRLLDRLLPADERARSNRLLERWGVMAVLITRPVPLLAETVALLAGASPLGWGRVTLAALAGNLPAALLYALVGHSATSVESGLLAFAMVLAAAGVFWLATLLVRRMRGGG